MHQAQSMKGIEMHRILGIVSVSAAMILLTMDAGIATVALPFIARDMGMAEADIVLLIVGYNLVMAMTLLPMASLGEYFGLPVVFKAGLLLYLVGALLCLTTASFEWLVVARSIQALGAAASLLAAGFALGKLTGSDRATAARSAAVGRVVLGLSFALVGLAILTGYDKIIEAKIADVMPDWLVLFATRF